MSSAPAYTAMVSGVGGEGYVLVFLGLEAAYVGLAIIRHRSAQKAELVPA